MTTTKTGRKMALSDAKNRGASNGLIVSLAVSYPLSSIRGIRGAKKARLWLGTTLAKTGAELARLTGRIRPYDRRTVCGWERGKPMAREIMDAYGILIANRLTTVLGRTIGVRLIANSPWHVTAWTKCATCDKWFELHRAKQLKCDQCRAKGL